MPWNTIDPVTTSALIISGLQTIVSRRANLTVSPTVITVGSIHGGTSANVIPETVDMAGTIRTYDEQGRKQVKDDIQRTAEKIAESAQAKAEVTITDMYATTVNNDELARRCGRYWRRPVANPLHFATAGRIGGFFVLRPGYAGPVRVPRHHPTGPGSSHGRAQSQSKLLRR